MATRELNRLVYPAARSAGARYPARYALLRHQVGIGRVHVSGPFFAYRLGALRSRNVQEPSGTAFAEATVIDRKHVNSRGCQFLRQFIPLLALLVALVHQQYPWPLFGSCKV